MATYDSNIYKLGQSIAPTPYGGLDVFGYVQIAANVKLGQNDIIRLCPIPNNSRIAGFTLDIPSLDTGGGSATLTLTLEDDSSATSGGVKPAGTSAQTSPIVYVSASTAGQAGGIVTMSSIVAGVLGTTYANNQVLRLLAAAASDAANSNAVQLNFVVRFASL